VLHCQSTLKRKIAKEKKIVTIPAFVLPNRAIKGTQKKKEIKTKIPGMRLYICLCLSFINLSFFTLWFISLQLGTTKKMWFFKGKKVLFILLFS